VDENLITVTKWLNGGKRHGIWNGRDVDLIVAWNSRFAKSVERETNGHYLTRVSHVRLPGNAASEPMPLGIGFDL
jgi:hypothetical protein